VPSEDLTSPSRIGFDPAIELKNGLEQIEIAILDDVVDLLSTESVPEPRLPQADLEEFNPADVAQLEEQLVVEIEAELGTVGDGGDANDVLWIGDDDLDEPTPQVSSFGATADPVKDYLRIISRISLLNAEEEVELAKAVEAGLLAQDLLDSTTVSDLGLLNDYQVLIQQGLAANQRLVESNLRLVVSLARRYAGNGLPFLDLIQEGNLGLMHAVEKFDYAKGYKFSTYATWWIRQTMSRAIADKARLIRVPVHMVEQINQVRAAARQFEVENDRQPSLGELALALGDTEAKILEIKRYALETLSLDHIVAVDDGLTDDNVATIYGLLSEKVDDSEGAHPDELIEKRLLRDHIMNVVNSLDEREAGIIKLRFGLVDDKQRTLEEIGQLYGVTRERIRQIEAHTITTLRKLLTEHSD